MASLRAKAETELLRGLVASGSCRHEGDSALFERCRPVGAWKGGLRWKDEGVSIDEALAGWFGGSVGANGAELARSSRVCPVPGSKHRP